MDDTKLAIDITDCSECPLENECSGKTIFTEPPCASWNDDDEIYSGMFDRE